jgi:CO/xanthine dehydrogenase Mo-binding subunit
MAERINQELAFELWQHEVPSAMSWFEVDRREFLKLFGGGLLVCLCARNATGQESGRGNFGGHELPKEIAAWLHISEDGHVTAYTGKVEMGQNIRTSLAQQVAEELRVPVDSIAMIMGDTDLTPWDAGTFGSRTTPTMGPQLKNMAVAAREQLVNMAAQRWNTQPSTLVAADGKVTNPQTHQSLTYGEITRGQKLVQLVEDPPFTPATEWKIAGKPVPKVDGRAFVTGKHKYTSDVTRPGMLHGKVLRPTGFKATLTSFNDEAVKKISGVTVVHDGDFVGVTAPDSWNAERAIEAIKSEWKVPVQPSNQQLVEYLKKNVTEGERGSRHTTGSVEEALASADAKLSATYTVQYIAHAPLEPRAAVAEWSGDKLTVWTGTQRPFAVRDELASSFHIQPEKVRVMVPDTGSAYGGKHTGECAIEAARLAKAAGKPVKLVWTREEEFTWAYFRPGGVIETRSGVKKDGTVVAWEFHNYNSGPSGIGTPYNIPNQLIQFHPVDSPLRQGSYRGLAATANHFSRESHMDELAHAVKMDPLEFRLKNLTDPRLRAVLQAAAEKFGWGKLKPAAGRGFGLACGFEKGGYVGTCAEVEVDPTTRNVQIRRVVETFECGAVVNPDGLRNQVEGSIVQAIGGALFEAIRFDNGRVLNPHFTQYRVPRFRDTPQIEVVLVDRKDLPSAGAGETPIMGLAPAVGNAIFAATGMRIRSLPMVPEGIPAPQS